MEDGYYWCKVVEFSAWTICKIKGGFVVSDYTLRKYEIDQLYEIGDKIDIPEKYRASIEQQVQPDSGE